MIIKLRTDFPYSNRLGYKIPSEFKLVAHILADCEEVKQFVEENRVPNYDIFIALETEEEKNMFAIKKEAWIKARKEAEEKEHRDFIINYYLAEAPQGVVEEVSSWEIVSKSPYSKSFYNSKEIGWDSKPEGSLRVSDHWNFESKGEKHCKLDTTDEYITGVWILARYENGIYHEIKRF